MRIFPLFAGLVLAGCATSQMDNATEVATAKLYRGDGSEAGVAKLVRKSDGISLEIAAAALAREALECIFMQSANVTARISALQGRTGIPQASSTATIIQPAHMLEIFPISSAMLKDVSFQRPS